MKLIAFPEQTIVIAKDQPEYQPLPAFQYADDPEGKIAFCWQLSWRERLKFLFIGKLWHQVRTFHEPLQPQMLSLEKPFTPEQAAAGQKEKQNRDTARQFYNDMVTKYGERIRKNNALMDSRRYHPNDRRRCIPFTPEEFALAKEYNLIYLLGARIVPG